MPPGTRVRVVADFTAFGVDFRQGEELVFAGEMLDVPDGCDAWIFSVLPRAGAKYSEKVISGYNEFADPRHWLRHIEAIGK